ncbi:peptidoglycan DD-metalloendopeptidase family protein [Hymenobacter busanensis]|uniref:Peptidoglycan DD-metalloendopeptidase family protein n=1 Tax=Hymenobacter busanensis TaxID=2607656 RepID=A0A7L4ZT43_9BACT|nr:M23 family metallopeptidase [Hymenobacter busanensis]KAA9339727.1 peptidoglycan DD-metalloendopeptidase family protein [Hymenobacter busanensis]QHJ06519.1 peptidoglycan DD-metalloendopeptidase family protein [Hymenobacter busanensis]
MYQPTTRRPLGRLFYILLVLPLLISCGKQQTLQGIFSQPRTPHDAYARQLRQAGLDQTALGRDWLTAADRALQDSLVVTLPFRETGIFRADQAFAASYRYAVRTGEQITISLTVEPATADVRVFLDAFELSPTDNRLRPVASADTASRTFSYEAPDDRQHLLRVQPELLRAGRFTVRILRGPSLAFPVQGKSDAAAGSFWGADRDNGTRRHEGIDIFAKRGTPVVAAAPGMITRVNETPRGGRVVWLADAAHGQHLYYAHLDQQLVQAGQVVRIGDTLGLVGNTGNARTTPPHLHFGVYRGGQGAVDPFPFVRRADAVPPAPHTAPERLGQWVRLTGSQTALWPAPSAPKNQKTSNTLPKHTPLLVVGATADWLRVQAPSGQLGYVPARATSPEALRREAVATPADLLSHPAPTAAPLDTLPARSRVAVLGEWSGYRLVRSTSGQVGWVRPTT